MGSLAFYLVGIWLGSTFDPAALPRQLAAAAERGHLPIGFATELAPDLDVSLHHSRELALAYYQPPAGGEPERFALYAPFFVRGTDLLPIVEMPVDLADHYFHALLEADLRRQLARSGGELGPQLRRRATATMTDVPADHRLEAYVDAMASFGSHLLAVANELERKELQRRGTGGLCPLLGGKAPLLQLWERIFTSEGYTGDYVTTGGEVRTSQAVLAPADKEILLTQVLRTPWRGAVREDLAPRYCGR